MRTLQFHYRPKIQPIVSLKFLSTNRIETPIMTRIWPPTPNESTWKFRRNLWWGAFVALVILNYFMSRSVGGVIASLSFYALITTGIYWLGYRFTHNTEDWYHPRNKANDENPSFPWTEDKL